MLRLRSLKSWRTVVRRTVALSAGVVLSLTATRAPAQDVPRATIARIDSLFAPYSRTDAPGLAIAVVRDGRTIFAKGYGMADLEHRVAITPSTVFDVASVSKQFTGLAIAMLVGDGKIRLDDDVRRYIPEMANIGQPITINHLVHHTSGLRDWPGSLGLAGWSFDDVISFEQILTMAYHQRSLNFVPGSEYTYSNTGYNLLAETVQRVTGQSFRAWTDANLFRPLGMTRTVFRDDHTVVIPDRALGYSRAADGRWHAVTNNLTALGSSSLMSTVEDLARWVINFDSMRVGGAQAMALTRTRGVLNDGSTIPYAFGLSHGEYRGAATIGHTGSWAGFHARSAAALRRGGAGQRAAGEPHARRTAGDRHPTGRPTRARAGGDDADHGAAGGARARRLSGDVSTGSGVVRDRSPRWRGAHRAGERRGGGADRGARR